jgi:hypothetical protein
MNDEAPHKLKPALVPRPLWGRSLYRKLPRKQWQALRRSVLEAAANTCAYCAAVYEKNMVCHEVWAYDDLNHVATLTAFEIGCRDCDSVSHFGHTLVSAGDDALDDRGDHVIAQLMKVNGISEREAHKLLDDAFGKWMDRSKHKTWAIQIAPELIERHPILTDVKL